MTMMNCPFDSEARRPFRLTPVTLVNDTREAAGTRPRTSPRLPSAARRFWRGPSSARPTVVNPTG